MGATSDRGVSRVEGVPPRTRDDLTVVELDGESVVYDEQNGGIHHLNTSATIVWLLCDGITSEENISESIAVTFSLDKAEVSNQVRDAIRSFVDAGLLQPTG